MTTEDLSVDIFLFGLRERVSFDRTSHVRPFLYILPVQTFHQVSTHVMVTS